MSVENHKYPPTDAGIKRAIQETPFMEYWEERVDWGATIEHQATDRTLALLAVRMTLLAEPRLFTDEQACSIRNIDMPIPSVKTLD